MRSCCEVEVVQFYHRRNEAAIWTEEIGFGFSWKNKAPFTTSSTGQRCEPCRMCSRSLWLCLGRRSNDGVGRGEGVADRHQIVLVLRLDLLTNLLLVVVTGVDVPLQTTTASGTELLRFRMNPPGGASVTNLAFHLSFSPEQLPKHYAQACDRG